MIMRTRMISSCINNLRRNVLPNSMKFNIVIEALKEKIKKDYVIEALDTE